MTKKYNEQLIYLQKYIDDTADEFDNQINDITVKNDMNEKNLNNKISNLETKLKIKEEEEEEKENKYELENRQLIDDNNEQLVSIQKLITKLNTSCNNYNEKIKVLTEENSNLKNSLLKLTNTLSMV